MSSFPISSNVSRTVAEVGQWSLISVQMRLVLEELRIIWMQHCSGDTQLPGKQYPPVENIALISYRSHILPLIERSQFMIQWRTDILVISTQYRGVGVIPVLTAEDF